MGRLANAVIFSLVINIISTSVGHATHYTSVRKFSAGKVTVSITTDGRLGQLSQSDIKSWNIDIFYGNYFLPLTPDDSGFSLLGGSLRATRENLTFDFSSGDGLAVWQLGHVGDGSAFYCVTAVPGCDYSGQIGEQFDAYSALDYSHLQSMTESGVQTLASAVIPEPETWALMVAGFGGLGGVLRSRARRPAAGSRL